MFSQAEILRPPQRQHAQIQLRGASEVSLERDAFWFAEVNHTLSMFWLEKVLWGYWQAASRRSGQGGGQLVWGREGFRLWQLPGDHVGHLHIFTTINAVGMNGRTHFVLTFVSFGYTRQLRSIWTLISSCRTFQKAKVTDLLIFLKMHNVWTQWHLLESGTLLLLAKYGQIALFLLM